MKEEKRMSDKELDDLYTIWELQGEYYTDDDIPDIVNGLITKSENVLKELNEEGNDDLSIE